MIYYCINTITYVFYISFQSAIFAATDQRIRKPKEPEHIHALPRQDTLVDGAITHAHTHITYMDDLSHLRFFLE